MAKSKAVIRGGASHIVFASHDGAAFTEEIALLNVLSSPAARQADGTYQVTIGQTEDSEALETFLETFRVAGSAGTTVSTVYEDGEEDVEPVGDNIPYLYIYRYSAADKQATPKRKVFVAKGFIDATSGSDNQASNATSDPTIVFKTVKEGTTGGLAIVTGDFEATLVTPGAGPFSLPEGSTGKKFYLPKA